MEIINQLQSANTSAPQPELLTEIREIKKAFKFAKLIKSGKLASRPIEDLLKEL